MIALVHHIAYTFIHLPAIYYGFGYYFGQVGMCWTDVSGVLVCSVVVG
jgi:hypothetical protein